MSLIDSASLIVTPNGYKEGKLYSVIPSDGSGDMSVVRATTATRVNSSGLVELVPYNFMLDSETTWITHLVTITSGITDPNGGTNAYRVSDIAIGNVTDYVRKSENPMPLTTGSTITFSIFMKGSGTIATYIERSVSGPSFFSTKLHTLTSEYQRFTHTYTVPVDAEGFSVYVGNLTGTTATSVDIAFPQVVFGTVAKDYQKTETRLNIPRLDYSNGTCPSLLVEPQRTNVLQRSQEFDNAYWVNNGVTITANNTTAPDGTLTADRLTGVSGGFGVVRFSTWSATNNAASCFAKKNTSNIFRIANVTGTVGGVNFDLNSGTVSSVSAGFSATIEDFGNGWYRCTAVDTLGRNGTFSLGVTSASESVFIWGAQLEASYPTSYIPTTSASVTRNADVISKTGISSLIGQTEGTLFVDAYITGKSTSNGSTLFATDKVSSGAIMTIIYTASDALFFYVYDGSSFQCSLNGGSFNVGDRVKVACGYKNNDFVMYINGNLVATDTSGSVPATDTANINTSIYADNNGSFINAAALWKTRLTNDELERLTGTGFNTYAEMANYYNYITQ